MIFDKLRYYIGQGTMKKRQSCPHPQKDAKLEQCFDFCVDIHKHIDISCLGEVTMNAWLG